MTAAIAGYALAVSAGQAVYAPVAHANDGEPQLDPGETLKLLKPVLEDAARPKVLHNAKFATKLLRRHGVTLRGVQEDTMLAAYLLGESSVTLRSLALERFALEIPPLTDLLGTGQKQIALREAPAGDAAIYGCTNADLLLRLQADFAVRLAEEPQLSELYTEMELPLSRVLAEIELRGVALDADAIRAMGVDLEKEIDRHERAIYKAAGQEFNIGSPKQLSVVLFEELELPKSRKVTHGYSTDVRALERLIGAHPIVELIMQYREVSKLKSTYVDTLPELVHPETGRIHTDYNQAVAATGRLSSENPNLQNIPIRTETGREIRRAFIPRNGEDVCFLAADYSQIELRVLAHLSRDEHLIEGLPRRRGHPRRHGLRHLRRRPRRRHPEHASHRQDDELRRDLRSDRLRTRPAGEHRPQGGARLHRRLLRPLRPRGRVVGGDQSVHQGAGIRRDAAGPAAATFPRSARPTSKSAPPPSASPSTCPCRAPAPT